MEVLETGVGPVSLVAAEDCRRNLTGVTGFEPPSWSSLCGGAGPHNQSSRLWRRKLHKVGAKAACVDAAAAYVDVAGITLTEGGRTR